MQLLPYPGSMRAGEPGSVCQKNVYFCGRKRFTLLVIMAEYLAEAT